MNRSEDAWAVAIGLLLMVAIALGWLVVPAAPLPWTTLPSVALPITHVLSLSAVAALLIAATACIAHATTGNGPRYALSALVVIGLAVIARVVSAHSLLRSIGDCDVLVVLLLAAACARFTPAQADRHGARLVLRPWVWLHIGVTLLGVEVLAPRMLALGVAGIALIALVAPLVIIGSWMIATRVFAFTAPAEVLMIGVATALGGSSAAIATAAATRPRAKEVTGVLLVSCIATLALSHALPAITHAIGADPYIAATAIGGVLGPSDVHIAVDTWSDPRARSLAITLAHITQASLGLVVLLVAVYWVTALAPLQASQKPARDHRKTPPDQRPQANTRHPLPIAALGLLLTSALASFVLSPLFGADAMNELSAQTRQLRHWCVIVACASFGLELGPRVLRFERADRHMVVLYALGLIAKLVLTLALATAVLGTLSQLAQTR